MASCALLWCSLPLLVLGAAAPILFTVVRWMVAMVHGLQALMDRIPECCRSSVPAMILGAVGLGYSLRTFHRLTPRNKRRRFSWSNIAVRFGRRKEALALQEAWPRIMTAGVFTLHAVLPVISTYSAVSVLLGAVRPNNAFSVPVGWDILHRLSGFVLGLYSLFCVISHQLQGEQIDSEYPDIHVALRFPLKCLHFSIAAARGCCVLVAWTYASLALDYCLTSLSTGLGWLPMRPEQTVLGVVGPVTWLLGADTFTSPFTDKAVAFTLNIVSVASQQRLVELLSRREVLLRLIGAEKMMASTLCLLLKGVAVACGSSTSANPLSEFLTSVAPPAACCVTIVTLREHGLLIGTSLVLIPPIVSSGFLNSAASFTFGIASGAYASHAFLHTMYVNGPDLDSPALRLALLIPGAVSSRAKGLLRGALVGARTRAVQMMAMGIIQRAAQWLYSPRF